MNEFAARVWRACDGETSVVGIATALGEDERAVWLALHQLTKAQLLTEAIAFPSAISAAKSRREVAGRLGLGAAAFVTSIVAPLPAQAASAEAAPEPPGESESYSYSDVILRIAAQNRKPSLPAFTLFGLAAVPRPP